MKLKFKEVDRNSSLALGDRGTYRISNTSGMFFLRAPLNHWRVLDTLDNAERLAQLFENNAEDIHKYFYTSDPK